MGKQKATHVKYMLPFDWLIKWCRCMHDIRLHINCASLIVPLKRWTSEWIRAFYLRKLLSSQLEHVRKYTCIWTYKWKNVRVCKANSLYTSKTQRHLPNHHLAPACLAVWQGTLMQMLMHGWSNTVMLAHTSKSLTSDTNIANTKHIYNASPPKIMMPSPEWMGKEPEHFSQTTRGHHLSCMYHTCALHLIEAWQRSDSLKLGCRFQQDAYQHVATTHIHSDRFYSSLHD